MSDTLDLQAVLFFLADDLSIDVVMPWSEFEAVQMGAASLSTLAGRTVKTAYAGVDGERVIRGLVLFEMVIDPAGQPVANNLPLRHLLASGGPGPDLGHGPIRLASRSQCPVPWHQRQMWHTEDLAALQRLQYTVFHNVGLISRRLIVAAPEAAMDPPSELDFTPSRMTAGPDSLRVELQALRDKLRQSNDEVERLRAALAHEQDRNRRLQDRLLGL